MKKNNNLYTQFLYNRRKKKKSKTKIYKRQMNYTIVFSQMKSIKKIKVVFVKAQIYNTQIEIFRIITNLTK